jgi:hypothetical protein
LSERVAAVMHYHGANMVPDLRMRTPDRNDDKQIAEVYALRDVFRFVLRAVRGDTAAARAMFERYLAGELPEELLAISRQCVKEDSAKRETKSGARWRSGNGFDFVQ